MLEIQIGEPKIRKKVKEIESGEGGEPFYERKDFTMMQYLEIFKQEKNVWKSWEGGVCM